MKILFLIFSLTISSAFANTNASSPPLQESDAFHNSAFGATQASELQQQEEQQIQERQEEAPIWITPEVPQKEETKSNRVNEWQDQSERAKSGVSP